MALSEQLHNLLVKLRDGFDAELPDPQSLPYSGQRTVKGHELTIRSSVPIESLEREQNLTVYIHQKPEGGDEEIRYYHYEAGTELAYVYVMLSKKEDGSLRQSISVSTLPHDMALARINGRLGEKQERRRGAWNGAGASAGNRNRAASQGEMPSDEMMQF